MALRQLPLKDTYRSGRDSLINDFFRPALEQATHYWRAVGYFSSSALEAFGAPLATFIDSGGHIRLITSVELSERDLEAVEQGLSKRQACEERLQEVIDQELTVWRTDGIWRLVRLIELGRLTIQIAVPKDGCGIYHEKVGVFIDEDDYVAFSGSSNESRNAFENNRECIDVYASWQESRRASDKRQHFEELWEHHDPSVEVFSFPEAAKRRLLRAYEDYRPATPHTLPVSNRWRHQDEALNVFLKKERGVLNMATGTGKTRTALKILTALIEKELIDSIIIATDGTDLLHQWSRELVDISPHLESQPLILRDFDDYKESQEFTLSPFNTILIVSRAKGQSRDPLASALRALSREEGKRTLLIHDEVHKLGSRGNRERLDGLSDHIRFRLGLSATPEREYDEEGNKFIESHIGPVLMTFELSDAIKRGILAPFRYHPLQYQLSDDDRKRVQDVYRRQAARAAEGNPMSDEELWIELAKVPKTSLEKLAPFAKFIDEAPSLLNRCIIFVETQDYGEHVLDLVHRHCPEFHTYFSGEPSDTLKRFSEGDLQCLITCHRLSEGIDIRDLNTVVLFSSARAKLETIQRIGRCLRTDPKNPKKTANVIDFVRQSAGEDDMSADEERRGWLHLLSTIEPEE